MVCIRHKSPRVPLEPRLDQYSSVFCIVYHTTHGQPFFVINLWILTALVIGITYVGGGRSQLAKSAPPRELKSRSTHPSPSVPLAGPIIPNRASGISKTSRRSPLSNLLQSTRKSYYCTPSGLDLLEPRLGNADNFCFDPEDWFVLVGLTC